MAVNICRGDAVAHAQVLRIGPPAIDQLTARYTFTIGGKTLAVDGWDAGAIATAWADFDVAEFNEITAEADDGALVLTGPDDGTPFDVAVTGEAVITIETVTAGSNPTTEVQRVTLPPATGGTFTLSYDAFTSAAIPYNATAEDVEDAISDISLAFPNITVHVSGPVGGPFDLTWDGAMNPAELIVLDASGLTGAATIEITELVKGEGSAATDLDLIFFGTTRLWYGTANMVHTIGVTTAGEIEAFLEGVDGKDWTVTGTNGIFNATLDASEAPPIANIFIDDGQGSGGQPGESDDTGVVEGTFGAAAVDERQRIVITGASGGTFTLTFSGQTTGAIAHNALASDVKTALEALSNITSVNVAGVAGGPWTVIFTNPGAQDVALMTADASGLESDGTVTRKTEFSAGTAEVRDVTLPDNVTGGTFVLIHHDGDQTTPIDFDATAAELDAALEAIESIGTDGVSVVKTSTRSWRVTFAEPGAIGVWDSDASALTVGGTTLVAVTQAARGPTHWNDPLNWTELRPPETGDVVWLDQTALTISHSLRQRTGFSLYDADSDTLIADGPLHFADGQKITLRTTDTLPTGLAPGDYFVVRPDAANRTFKLSATRGGAPVNITDAGTGAHTAAVELDELHVAARYNGSLGLPRRNTNDYWEYRPIYLEIGLRSAGEKLVRIGRGDGDGSGLVRIDLGVDEADVKIFTTGTGTELGVPACVLLCSNSATDLVQLDGDLGLGVFPDEQFVGGTLDVRGGTVAAGESVVFHGEVTARPGSVRGRIETAAGQVLRFE